MYVYQQSFPVSQSLLFYLLDVTVGHAMTRDTVRF